MNRILVLLQVVGTVSLQLAGAVVNITQPPQNTMALVGTNVTLTCGTQDPVVLFQWSIDDGSGTSIYTFFETTLQWGNNIERNRFRQANKYGLAISNLSLADGSVYKCSYLDNVSYRSAVVIVTEIPAVSAPSVTIAGSIAFLMCSVAFGGPDRSRISDSQYPVFSMTIGGEVLNNTVAPVVTKYNSSIYFLSRTVNYTVKAGDNEAVVECNLSSSVSNFTTSNSATLNVQFPAQITQLLVNKIVYVGDQIICVTSGNPTPLVTWTALNTSAVGNTTTTGSILTIRSDMAGVNVWNCAASNNLGSDIQQISFIVDNVPEPTGSPVTLPGSGDTWKLAVGLGVGLGVGIPLLIILIVIIVCCIRRCRKQTKKSATNEVNRQPQQLEVPPPYSSSNQQLNNELTRGVGSSLAPPVYAEIVRQVPIGEQTQRPKPGADITGFGDVSFGNWSGQDLSPKVHNDVGAPRQSGRVKPISSRSPQKNTNVAVSQVPDPVDEMEGYINLSYTANDESNQRDQPDEAWLNKRSPEHSIQSYQKFDWPDRHTPGNINYRSQPPQLESDSDRDNDDSFKNGYSYPVHLQSAAPVPQPRRSIGSYSGTIEPQEYPSQPRQAQIPYRYPEPPRHNNNLDFIRDPDSGPAVYYTPLRYNAPVYDNDKQLPYQYARNDGQERAYGHPYAPYDIGNSRPSDYQTQRTTPFSPARRDGSFDSVESNERSFGNKAFDAGSYFGSPQDLSSRSNQMLQVLGASRSVDV